MIKQIGTIPAENLLGMEIDLFSKLRSGAITTTHLERFLKKQNPFFRTALVRVGNLGSLDVLKRKLKEINYGHETWFLDGSYDILSPSDELVEIVIVTPADLGYTEVTHDPDEFFERATSKRFGFELCPVEVAFKLLFIESFQRRSEWLHIAIEPLVLMENNNMLMVNPASRRINSWYLGGKGQKAANYISLDDPWVFRLPKESLSE